MSGVTVVLAWRSRMDKIAYQKLLDEEKEDVVEVGEEEERLLGRGEWRS